MKFSQSIIRYTAILLTAALVVISANAQEVFAQEATSRSPKDDYLSAKDIGENPLKRADTSSPRDTLHSFLAELDILLEDHPQGTIWKKKGC